MPPGKKAAAAKRVKKAPPRKTTGRVPQALEADKVGFLNLAPETRNEIYGMWAQDILSIGIRAKGKAHTTAAHPIVNLSHLVHKEFCGVLAQFSPVKAQRVKVQIVDLDFYPLITFLNRVIANPEADYNDFKLFGGRSLIVDLTFTKDFGKDLPVEKVAKWFRYQGRTVPGLEFTMRIFEVSDAAKTRAAMDAMMTGLQQSTMWRNIAQVFGEWEIEQQAPQRMQALVDALLPPQPKNAMEQAVADYYDNIYKQVDAVYVPPGAWAQEWQAAVEEEGQQAAIKNEEGEVAVKLEGAEE